MSFFAIAAIFTLSSVSRKIAGFALFAASALLMTAFDRFCLRRSPLLGVIAGPDPASQLVGAGYDSRGGLLDRRVKPGDDG
ncbi:MAG TPA: hypothetical protein VMQ73_25420 [Methylomirabilota bacterium]|nr:hypothetical protein [Methylomirabilota bacterium]